MKVKSNTCPALLTGAQKRFTISEVAADWHELMIPQRSMRSSIARLSEQVDPRFAASRHTTAPISHTMPSPRRPSDGKLLLISHPTECRRLSWPEHTVG